MNTNERGLSVAIVILTLVALAARTQSTAVQPEEATLIQVADERVGYDQVGPSQPLRSTPRSPLSQRIAQQGPNVVESRSGEIYAEDDIAQQEAEEALALEDAYSKEALLHEPDVFIHLMEPQPQDQAFAMSDQEVFDQAVDILNQDQQAAFTAMWITLSTAEKRELLLGLRSAFAGY